MRKITKIDPKNPIVPKRKRVAAYARVSADTDATFHSLSAQVSHYSKYIQGRGAWEYMGVYADEALTGTKDNRPEFQRLLADCRAGKIDIVLTKSISRFARNTVDTLETIRELKQLGVDVQFERENIRSMSGDGELMLTILAAFAQEESRSASENCKWRIRKDFTEGKPLKRARVYGYRYEGDEMVVAPEEAEVVRMIFADYLSGAKVYAIVKKLMSLGIPNKTSLKWYSSDIKRILRCERYIGDTLLQRTFVDDHLNKKQKKNNGELPMYYAEGTHEAIIDKAMFEAAQAELTRRAAEYEARRYAK